MNFDSPIGHMGMSIPRHTQETLEGYLIRGWEPGGFVTSMLAMDMERALATADTANRQMMWAIGKWIVENAPEDSWGNYDLVKAWCKDVDGRRSKWATWNTLATQPEKEKDFDF